MSIIMIKLCVDYLRLTLFCSGLLIGIQAPAVVDQYEKRVNAQLTEASALLDGFQATANRYFNGNIEALLRHYESSKDVVFNHDAQNIRYITERVAVLTSIQSALTKSAVARIFHVLVTPDHETLTRTMVQYSYVILIDQQALIWGVLFGLVCATLIETLLHALGYCTKCLIQRKFKGKV